MYPVPLPRKRTIKLKLFKKLLSFIDLNKDGKIQWWEATLFIIGGVSAYYAIDYLF